MSESLKFADGTIVPVIGLYHNGAINFQKALRDQITARIASSVTTSDALQALATDTAKTVKITHTYGDPQQTQEYDNYVIPHHVSYEYNAGDGAYEYYLSLCAKTDTEIKNAMLESYTAAKLEGQS